MTGSDAARIYESQYAPSVEDLRHGLPEMGDGLQAQLVALYEHPNAVDAERVAANLAGAQRAVLKFREAMLREGTGDDQCAW